MFQKLKQFSKLWQKKIREWLQVNHPSNASGSEFYGYDWRESRFPNYPDRDLHLLRQIKGVL